MLGQGYRDATRDQRVIQNSLGIARDYWQKLVDELTEKANLYDAATPEERAAYHADPEPGPNGERFVNIAPSGGGMRQMARLFQERLDEVEALLKRHEDADEKGEDRCIACGKEDEYQ